jgi:hypothetical protein
MVATLDALKGLSLWGAAMTAPILMTYIDNTTFRLIFLTLVYPTVLSFLCRSGHFWVSHKVVLIASVVTFLVALALQMSQKVDDAVKDPDNNRLLAGVTLGTLLVTFLGIMFVSSKMVDMYDASEFNANNPW